MKRVLLAFVLAANPAMAVAQSDARRISEATAALPEHLGAAAKVVMTNADGSERVLGEGSSGFVCRPDGPAPGATAESTGLSTERALILSVGDVTDHDVSAGANWQDKEL